jgi:hypothetical protein
LQWCLSFLESPSDRKVIYFLFETPEERLVRENPIVTDDENNDEAVEDIRDWLKI